MELVVSRDSGIGFMGGVGNKQEVGGDLGGDGAILSWFGGGDRNLQEEENGTEEQTHPTDVGYWGLMS